MTRWYDRPHTVDPTTGHVKFLGPNPTFSTPNPDHPSYGTPATLVYPSDRYPYVVVGGAPSGHYLLVAPVDYSSSASKPTTSSDGTHNGFPVIDRTWSGPDALANVIPSGIRRINRTKDGHYTDHGTPYVLGVARYRRDWSD